MLTLDLLYAVLQGLSPSYLTHLEIPWRVFCGRIQRALNMGHPPLVALKLALKQAGISEIERISKALGEVQSVMELPELSFRQKQALIALRYEDVASLSHLCRVLNWDRSHTYHRLAALVKKGYAFKFYGEKGPQYMAIYCSMEMSVKSEMYKIIQEHLEQFRSGSIPVPATSATLATPAILATHAISEVDAGQATASSPAFEIQPGASTFSGSRLKPALVDTT